MAWKIYGWGMLLLVLVTAAGRLTIHFKRPGSVTSWDLFEAVFNLVLIPGLFGFAYGRPYLRRLFWELAVPLAWVALVCGLFSPTHRKLVREKGLRVAVAASLASLVLNIPGIWAITLYAYFRPEIWMRR
jgi:hypothetical protein